MPSEVTRGLSVKAFLASWQFAQATSPVLLNRLSWKSLSPRAIFSAVWGLSSGTGTAGKPRGGAASDVSPATAPPARSIPAARSSPIRITFMAFPPVRDNGGRSPAAAPGSPRPRSRIPTCRAAQADQVVVGLGAAVVADGLSGMAGPGDDADPGEALERAVHRRSGDTGVGSRDGFVDLIRGGVVVEVEDGFQHGRSLRRQGQPVLPAEAPGVLDASQPRLAVHGAFQCTRGGHRCAIETLSQTRVGDQ
jgi:hypothetical protein